VALYRNALDAEKRRQAVFEGTEQPKWLTGVPDHVRLRLEAITHLAKGEHPDARCKLDEANALVPALAGTLNGKPFESVYDADEQFGTVLEVFGTGGIYSWVPFESVASLTMNAPKNPRDFVFRAAHLILTDGVEGDVLLPGLYPQTHNHPDDEVKLGRAIEWVRAGGDMSRGAGGKLFAVNDDFQPLTEWTEMIFTPPQPGAG
jgi:type VI secretion system protein ImpE